MEELVLHGQGYNRNDLLPSLRAVRRRRAVEEDGNNVVTMGGSIKVVLDNERQASEGKPVFIFLNLFFFINLPWYSVQK